MLGELFMKNTIEIGLLKVTGQQSEEDNSVKPAIVESTTKADVSDSSGKENENAPIQFNENGEEKHSLVDGLIRLLGEKTVLLPIRKGEKRPWITGWQKT